VTRSGRPRAMKAAQCRVRSRARNSSLRSTNCEGGRRLVLNQLRLGEVVRKANRCMGESSEGRKKDGLSSFECGRGAVLCCAGRQAFMHLRFVPRAICGTSEVYIIGAQEIDELWCQCQSSMLQ
jgi:hypothetical protein